MNLHQLNAMIFVATIFSSVIGFVATATLFRYTRNPLSPSNGPKRPTLRGVYQWGMIFFSGAALLAVNWAMGEIAPIPLASPAVDAEKLSFSTPLAVWLLICMAGIAVQRAMRVTQKPEATVEGRTFLAEEPPHDAGHEAVARHARTHAVRH